MTVREFLNVLPCDTLTILKLRYWNNFDAQRELNAFYRFHPQGCRTHIDSSILKHFENDNVLEVSADDDYIIIVTDRQVSDETVKRWREQAYQDYLIVRRKQAFKA